MKLAVALLLVTAAFWIGLNGLRMPGRTRLPLPVKQGPVELVPSPVPTQLTPR